VFVGASVAGQLLLGLTIALIMQRAVARKLHGAVLVRSVVLCAWVMPGILIGVVWQIVLNEGPFGLVNSALASVGLGPVSWLSDTKLAVLSAVTANIWRGTAFTMLIFLGALKTIPSDIYEAARVDGANTWRRFWDHTLPSLRPIAALALLSITMSTFGTFILIQTLTNGGPGSQTEVIALYAFHEAFRSYEIGYGSTIAVVMLVLNVAFAIVYLRWSRTRA
jgi:multiple sugar transport system permease protein